MLYSACFEGGGGLPRSPASSSRHKEAKAPDEHEGECKTTGIGSMDNYMAATGNLSEWYY